MNGAANQTQRGAAFFDSMSIFFMTSTDSLLVLYVAIFKTNPRVPIFQSHKTPFKLYHFTPLITPVNILHTQDV